MKNFKLYISAILLLLVLTVASVYATGDLVTQESITVNVDGVDLSSNVPLYVERGQELPISISFIGNSNVCSSDSSNNTCYDARIRVFIGGYEYGDVQSLSEIFPVYGNTLHVKHMTFRIPSDIPANSDYILNVEFFDGSHTTIISAPLSFKVQPIRHELSIYGVIFNPTNNVRAGQTLFASVRLENLGDNIEQNIIANLAIPALGIQTSQFVDKLVSEQDLIMNPDSTNRNAATTNDLSLTIPQDARTGDYEVVLSLNYNRGYSNTDAKKYILHIQGATPVIQGASTLNVNVDAISQSAQVGQGAVYKFSITNLGQTTANLNLEVLGAGNWASVRVDPQSLVIEPNAVRETFVYVSPFEGQKGVQTFNVNVKDAAGNIVSQKALTLNIAEQSVNGTTKSVLMISFIVLLALLVILLIVVIVKKLSEDKEEKVEGQTYY